MIAIRPARALVIAVAVACVAAAPVRAEEGGTLRMALENDLFTGTDRHYTNGALIEYTAPQGDLLGFVERGLKALDLYEGATWSASYALGQNLYTPEGIEDPNPPPGAFPYGAQLYGAVTLTAERETYLEAFRLELGVVGDPALGEFTQKTVHDIIGAEEPQGWDTQIKTGPFAGLSYERTYRHRIDALSIDDMLDVEFLPRFRAGIGNVDTFAAIGGSIRVGRNFADDYGATRIRTGGGSAVYRPRKGFGWSLLAGVEGRLEPISGLSEGALFVDFRGDPDARPVAADLIIGASVSYGGVELSYQRVTRFEAFATSDGAHSFGSLVLRVAF